MTAQNRTVLKATFQTGDTPTEAQFIDLIDSFPIIAEHDLKAPLLSPALVTPNLGTPSAGVLTACTVATASPGTNTTAIASTEFVVAEVAALVASAPGALNTLDELAAALGDDANYAATVTTALAGKEPTLTGSTITGKTLVTAAVGDSVLLSDLSDSGNLKKVTVQTIVDLASSGSSTPTVTVPARRTGTTLLFEDQFLTDGWGAGWTATTGTSLVKAGINNGPTQHNGSANFRKCRAVRKESPAVQSAGYTLPTAYYTIASASGAYCVSMWIRPSQYAMYDAHSYGLLATSDEFANPLDLIDLECAAPRYDRFRINYQAYGAPTLNGRSGYFPTGEWYLVWCALQKGQGTNWFIRDKTGKITQIAAATARPNYPDNIRVGFLQATAPGNQPTFSGQLSGFRIHQCSTWKAACDGPSDFVFPSAGVSYSVDPATGSDSNVNGPWATVDTAIQKINDNVVMGSSINFVNNSGQAKDYQTLGNVVSRRQFVVDYIAGKITTNSINDTITLANGTYRPAATLSLYTAPVGVKLAGSGTSEIRFSTVLSGSWTAPDGAYPKLWEYASTVALGGVPYAPGRLAFLPVFTSTLATAKTYLNTYDYCCWVSPSGDLWVSLPTGETPATLAALTPTGVWEYALGSMPDWTGGMAENLKLSGITSVNYAAGSSDRVGGAYGWWTNGANLTTIFVACTAEGYTKHVMASVGTLAEGLTIYDRPRYGGQPPAIIDAWNGVGTGDYSPLVDYTSDDTVQGSIVSAYIDPGESDAGFLAVPGRATGNDRASSVAPYVTHTNGGPGHPFALTMFVFSGDCPANYFGAGTPPVARPVSHKAFELLPNGSVDDTQSKSYLVAALPRGNAYQLGWQIFVSNEAGGAVLAFTDGTNWRRVTDRAIVS
jgi:hypothetical protein